MGELFYFDEDRSVIKKALRSQIGLLVFVVAILLTPFTIKSVNYWVSMNGGFAIFSFLMLVIALISIIRSIRFLRYRLKLQYHFKENSIIGTSPSNEYEYLISNLSDIQISLQTTKSKFLGSQEATWYKFSAENLKEVKHLSLIEDSIFIILRFNDSELPMDDDIVHVKKTIEPNYFIIRYREELLPFVEKYNKILN